MIWLLSPLVVGVTVWQTSIPAGFDRIWESAPLTAALLGGMWILFGAYRGLVDRVIIAIENNTQASTRVVEALERIEDRLNEVTKRVTTLESHDREDRR